MRSIGSRPLPATFMEPPMKSRCLCAGALVLALLHPAQGRAETFNTCVGFVTSLPAVISTQGTWCLRQDLATGLSSGTAITVAANNVTLDCNDFKLGGLAGGEGTLAIGVGSLDRQNITVRHCNIRGFLVGVQLTGQDSAGHVVEDNRIDGATGIALHLVGDDSLVRRNVMRNTGGSTSRRGMAAGISTGGEVEIVDNTVTGVFPLANIEGVGTAYGILAANVQGGSVRDNRVRNLIADGPSGLAVGITAEDNARTMITGNQLIGNGDGVGVVCDNAFGRIRDNMIHGFTAPSQACTDAGDNDVSAEP